MIKALRKRRDFLLNRIRNSERLLSWDIDEAHALHWAVTELVKSYPDLADPSDKEFVRNHQEWRDYGGV
jgi:hypothetical protein